VPNEQDVYIARCLRVTAAATADGVLMRKLDKTHGLEVSARGKSVVFPIVTDDRMWKATTVEEAFYCVLIDARGWANASLEDVTISQLDATEKGEVALISRDLTAERLRIAQLSDVLGPDKLAELYNLAEL